MRFVLPRLPSPTPSVSASGSRSAHRTSNTTRTYSRLGTSRDSTGSPLRTGSRTYVPPRASPISRPTTDYWSGRRGESSSSRSQTSRPPSGTRRRGTLLGEVTSVLEAIPSRNLASIRYYAPRRGGMAIQQGGVTTIHEGIFDSGCENASGDSRSGGCRPSRNGGLPVGRVSVYRRVSTSAVRDSCIR